MTDATRPALPPAARPARLVARGAADRRTETQRAIAADIAATLSTLLVAEARDGIRAEVIARAVEGETTAALALLGYW